MYKIILLCLCMFSSISAYSECKLYEEQLQNKDESFTTSNSIIQGAIAGALPGLAAAFFDHIMPRAWPLTWIVAFGVRHDLVNSFSNSLRQKKVAYNRELMMFCSFVSTWLVYWKSYQMIHGEYPF